MTMLNKTLKFIENPNPNGKEVAYALLALRVAVGLFFVTFGFGKLFGTPGLEMVTEMFTGLGFPVPGALAFLVGVAEFFGGPCYPARCIYSLLSFLVSSDFICSMVGC